MVWGGPADALGLSVRAEVRRVVQAHRSGSAKDVSDATQVEGMVQDALARFGRIDLRRSGNAGSRPEARSRPQSSI